MAKSSLVGIPAGALRLPPAGFLRRTEMNPCFFEDRTARQRIAAEMIVAKIERNLALRRLQKSAI